jgi:menaquinol-cytochrome c reductase iron-sulfur subunit
MDRQLLLAIAPVDTTRRRFFKLTTVTLGFLSSLTLGLPFIGALVGPAFRAKKRHFAKVTDVTTLPTGQPVNLTFASLSEDAYLRETVLRTVWVVKRSASEVTVFSPICPHLGCQYDWHAQQHEFICPCHGSVFAADGHVLAGPAPRPLDTLAQEIKQGVLFVEWERFALGVPEKISV